MINRAFTQVVYFPKIVVGRKKSAKKIIMAKTIKDTMAPRKATLKVFCLSTK